MNRILLMKSLLLFLVDAYCSFRVFLWKLIFLHIFIWFKISSLSQKWPHLQEDLIIKCLGDNDVTAQTLVSNLAMFFAIISNFNWPYALTILAFNFIDYRFVSIFSQEGWNTSRAFATPWKAQKWKWCSKSSMKDLSCFLDVIPSARNTRTSLKSLLFTQRFFFFFNIHTCFNNCIAPLRFSIALFLFSERVI